MESSRICRTCLDVSRPLNDLLITDFCPSFTELTGLEVSKFNGLPCGLCSECLHYVKKFSTFKEKSKKSQDYLLKSMKLLENGSIKFKFEKDFISHSQLVQSSTFILDLSQSLKKTQNDVYFSSNKYTLRNKYCFDKVNTSKLNTSNIKCEHIKHEENSDNNEEESLSISEIKLEDIDNDCNFDNFSFQIDDVSQKENRKEKNNTEESDIVNQSKRSEKKAGERTLDFDNLSSNNDERFDFDIDDDSDSFVNIKKPKKRSKIKDPSCKKRKKNKKAEAERIKNIHRIANQYVRCEVIKSDREIKPKPRRLNTSFNSRMVLETEQYKVIKLNNEQLVAEMVENSKSERYLNAPYKCTLCVKGFNYEDVLQNHMSKHIAKNGYLECELCHQYMPSSVSMRGHKKSHSTKYQCKQCGIVKASRQHLLEHYMLIHEGKPRTYICNVCGKTLVKRTMFQKHMRIHFPSNKITCDKCGKLFKTIETLRAHMLRHADIKRYSCDQCSKAFRYASLLYTHKATHVTTKNFYCVECDMRFKTQSNLRLHLKKSLKHVDPDTLRYGCEHCDKRYDDEKGLRRHIEWVHLRIKNFKCSKCDMQFGSQDGLRSHVKKIHDGIRPPRNHVCEICQRAFRAKAVLVKHIRVHTGERPFECKECGKKFAQNSTMSTHIKLVHLKMQRCVNRKKSSAVNNQTKKLINENIIPVVYQEAPLETGVPYYFPSGSETHRHIQLLQISKLDEEPKQTM